MIKELSKVRLKNKVSGINVPQGMAGTVVMVYLSPYLAYEVEFTDQNGVTWEDPQTGEFTFTLKAEEVELID